MLGNLYLKLVLYKLIILFNFSKNSFKLLFIIFSTYCQCKLQDFYANCFFRCRFKQNIYTLNFSSTSFK